MVTLAALVTTCGDQGPLGPDIGLARAGFDLTGLARAGGNLPIPVDTIRVTLRRNRDNSIAVDTAISINASAIHTNQDTIAISLRIGLKETPEDFHFLVQAEGRGVVYYTVNGDISVAANGITRTPEMVPTYVGPGSTADSITMSLTPLAIAGGDSALVWSRVWDGDTVVPGVPVGYSSSDTIKLNQIRYQGVDSAWVHAPLTLNDSVDIIALTPTGLTQSMGLAFAPPPTQLVIVSGDGQSVAANAQAGLPLLVELRDASGNPFPHGKEIVFAVTSGPGSVAPLQDSTDGAGRAQTTLTAGGTAGAVQVSATATGITGAAVTFGATVTGGGGPGAPDTLVIISGNNQTAAAGSPLPAPLVVEVRDQAGVPVPGVTVDWSPVQGSVAPTSGQTDGAGRAQTVWTLGTGAASQSLTATALTLTPQSFSATATFATPTILLGFAGVPGVGVGLSTTINVGLSAPAGAGGVTVAVTSDAPAVVSVGGTGNVVIPQNQSSGTITVNGLTLGSTTIRGSAGGYTQGTLTVDVQDRAISLPGTLNVPYGQTASLPIQLAAPAPAGGVTFSVVSSNTNFVGVQAPTVFIAAGALTANATLQGILPGPSTITVSNPSYTSGTSAVATTASLNILQGSASLDPSFGTTVTVAFESNGGGIAAPSPGISVTMAAADPTCLTPTSPVTIATGLVNTTSSLSYGGSATLPCTTRLVATAPNLQPDSISVTVNPVPGISLSSLNPTGSGLMDAGFASMGASNHGGVTVTLASSDPTVTLLAPNPTTPGADTIQVFVQNGSNSFSFYIQGVEGQTGTATITATATGFSTGTTNATIVTPAIEFHGLPGSTTTLSADNNIYAQVGVSNGQGTSLAYVQNVRPGITGGFLTVTFVSDTPAVGVITDSTGSAATRTARIVPGLYYTPTSVSAGGVGFHPITTGVSTVEVSSPGFTQMTSTAFRAIAVTQPGIVAGGLNPTGGGLMEGGSITLGASQHGGVVVTVTSSNPGVVLVSPNATTPGTDSIDIAVANGTTFVPYVIQGVEGQSGTSTINVSSPLFTSGSAAATIVTPGIEFHGLPTSTTTLSSDNAIYAQVGVPNGQGTSLAYVQNVRPGIAGGFLPITFVSDSPSVGVLVDSVGSAATRTARIIPGFYYSPTTVNTGGVAFHPLSTGVSTLNASTPGFTQMPATDFRAISVVQPGITLSGLNTTGAGLMDGGNVSLGASQHGGVTVTVKTANPAVVLVSPNDTTPGTDSIQVSVANGVTSINYYIQGVEGQTGTGMIIASTPLFAPDTVVATIVQPGVEFHNLPTTTTTLSADNNIYAQVGIPNGSNTGLSYVQNVRPGIAGGFLTATFTSGTPTVGVLADSIGTANSRTARIMPRFYYTPTTVGTGGVAFHPILAGTTQISVDISGFIRMTSNGQRSVAVTPPGITMSGINPTGGGLMDGANVTLGAGNHGGVTVTVVSSNPGVALVSPNSTTPGTDSFQVFVANGVSNFTYYLQGVEGQTGTVTITGRASGFTNGTTTASIVQPGVEIHGIASSVAVAAGDVPFYAQVGVPIGTNTNLSYAQNVRPGIAGGGLTVTLNSTAPAVGTLFTQAAGAGSPRTAFIPSGLYYSQTFLSPTAGVAFRPLTPGGTTVTVDIPLFIRMTNFGNRSVTVTP